MIMNFETAWFCNEAIAADFEAYCQHSPGGGEEKPRHTSVMTDGDLA
jgi:hypothetical protein